MARRNILAGLDVGTSKVAVVIADVDEQGSASIIGYGLSASRGIRKGVVVDIEATVAGITEALDRAQRMAGIKVKSVYVGIAGAHIASTNNRGVIAVAREDKEITPDDVERAIDAARVVTVPPDREIVHVIPREFIVDGNDGIRDPVGMLGLRLELYAHIVTGSVTSIQNLLRSVYRAGLEVDEVILAPLASGEAVVLPAERDLGVVLADVGGGTTDVAIFTSGSLWFASTLPIGGEHITKDLAVGLRTPIPDAERLKVEHGLALAADARDEVMIDVPSMGGNVPRQVSERLVATIIEPRIQEIFHLIGREIRRSGYEGMIPGGLVLTGGTALLRGAAELAARELDLSVRVGTPRDLGGMNDIAGNPLFATAVGIVRYAGRMGNQTRTAPRVAALGTAVNRLRGWFKDFF